MGSNLLALLTQEFLQAKPRGEIGPSAPAAELTRIVMHDIFGFLVIEGESQEASRQLAHQILEYLIEGVSPS